MPDLAYTTPEVSNIVGLVDTYIRWKEYTDNDRTYEMYHPSAFGKCLRLMQYQRYDSQGHIKGEHIPKSSKLLRLFANGHAMHERWKDYFEGLGVLRGVWACCNAMCRLITDAGVTRDDFSVSTDFKQFWSIPEKDRKPRVYGKEELQGIFKPEKCICGCTDFRYDEVAVHDEELNFHGHADILLDFRNFKPEMFDEAQKKGLSLMFDPAKLPKGIVVIDMKTIGTKSYQNSVLKTGAHKYYEIQLTIYINILKCDFGLLLYEEKDQFEISAFRMEQNPEWWAAIRKQSLLMSDMVKSGKKLLPPPRPISKSSYECKDCSYKKWCHKAGGIWDDPQLDEKRKDFYGALL
jgi:hypothetical protein